MIGGVVTEPLKKGSVRRKGKKSLSPPCLDLRERFSWMGGMPVILECLQCGNSVGSGTGRIYRGH